MEEKYINPIGFDVWTVVEMESHRIITHLLKDTSTPGLLTLKKWIDKELENRGIEGEL